MASCGRCRGRVFQVRLLLICLLSVCLPYSTGEPVQSWGVFTGAKLRVPGAGMVHSGPLEPRSQEHRQRPKPCLDMGLGLCTGWLQRPVK